MGPPAARRRHARQPVSRAERLLQLMQALRRRRQPVRGAELAQELDVSLRTLYRDIAALQAQGAQIDGEAGIGYRLKPGFTLPPLMFSVEEIEALVLGSRWVSGRGDPQLAAAARDALAKIDAVLPAELRQELDSSALLVGPSKVVGEVTQDLAPIRAAIRNEAKLSLSYRDVGGQASQRIVWPCALGFFDATRVLVAWCELRQGFRHFRCDRIDEFSVLPERYPTRRQALLAQWRETQRGPRRDGR